MKIRTCSRCHYWEMGIPCGHCEHPNALFMFTNDDMVFRDAGKSCPLNSPEYRAEQLKNVDIIISELRNSCEKNGIKGAVVGISGGKDSTIVAKLMTEVLGKENVVGVLMPNGEQSDIDDSYKVVNILNIPYTVVNIQESMKGAVENVDLGLRNLKNFDKEVELAKAAYINIAPRIRMTVLYAIAQSMGNGWRVIGTTNKSEEYIGWLTKWGDGGCDFEPIIDFTVTELRQLGKYLGLPTELVDKTPVDGLTPLSDEDRIGFKYSELDEYIMQGTTGNKDIDSKIERMHEYSEHKRNPIPVFKMKI